MIVFTKSCAKCGVDVRSDEEHECQNMRPKRKPSAKPVPKTANSSSPSPSIRRTETVKPPEPVKHPDVKHVKQLPAGDRAAYMREYMRAYQRKHRARQKAPE